MKKEGESYKKGESLCEMALVPSDLLVAVDAEEAGILAKILIPAGKSVPVNDPIAIFVHTQDDYFSYIEDQRIADADSHRHAVTEEVLEAATKRPDAKVLLRHVKHMIQSGDIEEGSGESFLKNCMFSRYVYMYTYEYICIYEYMCI